MGPKASLREPPLVGVTSCVPFQNKQHACLESILTLGRPYDCCKCLVAKKRMSVCCNKARESIQNLDPSRILFSVWSAQPSKSNNSTHYISLLPCYYRAWTMKRNPALIHKSKIQHAATEWSKCYLDALLTPDSILIPLK